jgi:hypothetical protein
MSWRTSGGTRTTVWEIMLECSIINLAMNSSVVSPMRNGTFFLRIRRCLWYLQDQYPRGTMAIT